MPKVLICFVKFMKKVVCASMVLCAWIGAMAQTEKTRGFDDLYHFIEKRRQAESNSGGDCRRGTLADVAAKLA